MRPRPAGSAEPDMLRALFLALLAGLAAAQPLVQMRPRTREGMWLLDTGIGDESVRDGEHIGSWLVSEAAAVYLMGNHAKDVEVVHPPTPAEVGMRTRAMQRAEPRSDGDENNPVRRLQRPACDRRRDRPPAALAELPRTPRHGRAVARRG
jgi:hypothetical protein